MAWTEAGLRKAAETRARNRAAKQAYLAGKQAATGPESGADAPVAAGDVTTPPLTVNVKEVDAAKPKLTLRERLGLGGGTKVATSTPVKRAVSKKRVEKPNLIVTMLPTILASLVATYARDRLPEEYQPCAPTRQEVQSVLGPILDIIGRRVEIAAEVSQDAIDISNAIICGFAYGVRAYVTYVDIKKAKEAGITYDQKQQQRREEYQQRIEREQQDYAATVDEGALAGGMRAYQATASGIDRDTSGSDGSRPASERNGLASNGAGNPDDDRELRDREAALIADMFKRDRGGRVKLGLLAG